MSSIAGPGNPILYAQFHSRGGWRSIAITLGSYVLLIGSLIALTAYESRPRDRSDVLTRWMDVLLGLQMLATTFFGTVRISGAVRADFKDHMIESHRLMPMPRLTAVFGYLLGPASHAILLGGATLIMGLIVCPFTHAIDPQRWLVANFMLAVFSLMLWAVSAQIAFSVRGGVLILVLAAFLLLANAGSAFSFLPGLALLTYPLVGHSVFAFNTSLGDVQGAYAVSLVAQAAVTAVCLAAAARKYRSRDGVGLNAPLGLLLLFVGVAISMAAMWEDQLFRWGWRGSDDARQRFASTVVTALLLALVPLASSARKNSSGFIAGGADRRPTTLVALAAILITDLLLLIVPTIQSATFRTEAACSTLIVITASIASFAALFRWAYYRVSKVWWIGCIWLGAVWIAPLVAQAVHSARADENAPSVWYYTGSPVGALDALWTTDPAGARSGIAFQLAAAFLPITLAIEAIRRERKQKSPAAEDLSAAGPDSVEGIAQT